MKKRIVAAVLALGATVSILGAAWASSQSGSLISRNYLEGTFLSELTADIGQWVRDAFAPIAQEAEEKLDQVAQNHQGGGQLPDGWTYTGHFTAQSGQAGRTISLSQGSGLLWSSGSAVSQGVLVDVTAGTELSSGGALVPGHRYLAGEEVTVTVSSQSASWAVEGLWTTGEGEIPDIPPQQLPFVDVPDGTWYYEPVRFVYENKLFQGVSDTHFGPMDTMDRKMMTTVLYRLAGEPAVEYEPMFQDIPAGQWYTLPTIWAGENGIVTGVGDGLFDPDSSVVRQQIAVILFRYAQAFDLDTSARGDLSAFRDEDSIAPWARDAMSWAVATGIVRGSGELVSPESSASRAEVATMLQRFDQWMNGNA